MWRHSNDGCLRSLRNEFSGLSAGMLASPAWCSLPRDVFTVFYGSTGAWVPRSTATLSFLGPLIPHTLSEFAAGQEFAGICLIRCRKQEIFYWCMDVWAVGPAEVKTEDGIGLPLPHCDVRCTGVRTEWSRENQAISVSLRNEVTDTGDDIFRSAFNFAQTGVHQSQLEALLNVRLLSPTITISDAGGVETKNPYL